MNAIKSILLILRRLAYFFIQKGNIVFGKKLNIHPNAKLVAFADAKIVIANDCSIASNGIILAEKGASICLENNVSCSRGVQIYARTCIKIGEGSMIGNNTLIFDHDHDYKCPGGIRANKYISSPIEIGRNVWLGCNVTILRGTVIGDNCVVGAGAIIKGIYPANSIIIQKKSELVRPYEWQSLK